MAFLRPEGQDVFFSDCKEKRKYIPEFLLLKTLYVHDCLNMQLLFILFYTGIFFFFTINFK